MDIDPLCLWLGHMPYTDVPLSLGVCKYLEFIFSAHLRASFASHAGPSSLGVGYNMMTFVIRNGLGSLKLGHQCYLAYVSQLARNWGLSPDQVGQVRS